MGGSGTPGPRTKSSRPRILFVHNGRSHFIELDLQALAQRYPVTELELRKPNPLGSRAFGLVSRHDLVFGWFASWHTLLPLYQARLMGKPSVLVIGGYDVADMPSIGYGHMRGGFKKWVARRCMQLATCLVTNSHFSQQEVLRNAGLSVDKVRVVHHGIPDPHGALPRLKRGKQVLTVGTVDRPNLWRKGHEPFVRSARLLPSMEFVLVGVWADGAAEYLRRIGTPNVTLTGRVDDETLRAMYLRAAAYVQVSAHEGFGLSVAEAMLGGCVPVVTRAGALPEVVGGCGVYVDSQRVEEIAHAVNEAADSSQSDRSRARQRILDHFPISKRRQAFYAIISQLSS